MHNNKDPLLNRNEIQATTAHCYNKRHSYYKQYSRQSWTAELDENLVGMFNLWLLVSKSH